MRTSAADLPTGESQATTPNKTIEAANGVRYAYRRYGVPNGRAPLVLLQHFRGNLDNWDPLLVDTLAKRREILLLDNTGVGLSSGSVPRNITAMARDAIAFADAMDLKQMDLLGYSIGGMIAQEVALLRPRLVSKLVLAGTGPQGGGKHMHGWITDIESLANADNNGPDDLIRLFFAPTETSIQKGKEYVARFTARHVDRDRPNGPAVRNAQYDAIVEWGIPDPSRLARLAGITQPTLVSNGDNDTMIPTVNSHILGDHLPNARVRIFPDAGHGFLFQWPVEFATLVGQFLD